MKIRELLEIYKKEKIENITIEIKRKDENLITIDANKIYDKVFDNIVEKNINNFYIEGCFGKDRIIIDIGCETMEIKDKFANTKKAYEAIVFEEEGKVTDMIYKCDKKRNTECKKTNCGTCNHTKDKKYAIDYYAEEESNFIDCINNEKYITRLLTFASTVLNPNVSCIVLSQKNVQELIEEIREDYIPKKVLDLELEERRKQLVNKKESYTNRIRLNEIKRMKRTIL